jgi:hypothetical protein
VEVIFLNAVKYHLQLIPFGYPTLFQKVIPSVSFSILETNPTFVTRYDRRDKSWVPVSLLS